MPLRLRKLENPGNARASRPADLVALGADRAFEDMGNAQSSADPAQILGNISTRLRVLEGENVLIAGMIATTTNFSKRSSSAPLARL